MSNNENPTPLKVVVDDFDISLAKIMSLVLKFWIANIVIAGVVFAILFLFVLLFALVFGSMP